ncbi:hypothetical protein TNCV_1937351 [Trichonephila clavipes]|nr:hypothetical protein TNCV_1937351 [Trichonephila clavipes]
MHSNWQVRSVRTAHGRIHELIRGQTCSITESYGQRLDQGSVGENPAPHDAEIAPLDVIAGRKEKTLHWTHQEQYLQIFKKADVQSVRRAYRGRLESTVEWMSVHVATARCLPKYKLNADEQLSPVV